MPSLVPQAPGSAGEAELSKENSASTKLDPYNDWPNDAGVMRRHPQTHSYCFVGLTAVSVARG